MITGCIPLRVTATFDTQLQQVAYLLEGGAETMHHMMDAAHLAATDWALLDARLKQQRRPKGRQDGMEAEAELLLWLDGVTPADLASDSARQRLLGRALSCGLRTNAFEFVLEHCQRLGFSGPFGTIDELNPANEIDLRMKHVRLLKRCGAYGDALSMLGKIASTLAAAPRHDDLSVAALLYSVAKSLGSHQSRTGQSRFLCTIILGRIRATVRRNGQSWRQFLRREAGPGGARAGGRAEEIWVKVADYSARLHLPTEAEKALPNPATPRALLRRWDDIIAFEEDREIKVGRCHFALQGAKFALAQSDDKRLLALRKFDLLLQALLSEVRPDDRGVAIRCLQAAQMSAQTQNWSLASQYATLSFERAATAADWQVMARALLLQSDLVVANSQRSPQSWGEALYLAQRARELINKLREPPLQLLFDHSVREARIALAMADHALALERIGQAIEHIARMRDALLKEDWFGLRAGSPEWLPSISRLLTSRQRTMMQTLLLADWQRLLDAQDALVEMLGSAHELENYLGNVAISAARENLMRSGLAHDIANVVSSRISNLIVERGVEHNGDKVLLARDVAGVQQQIEDEIRRYVGDGQDMTEGANRSRGNFMPASRLVAVDDRQLELLQTFTPLLPPPTVTVHRDFELRCDERLFNILFFQLLLNAAQELVTAASPRIEIVVSWSTSPDKKEVGTIEVIDSAGRVSQLRAAVEQLIGHGTPTSGRRGWGMQEALRFFSEALRCEPPLVGGAEGSHTSLQLRFPHGRTVSRGSAYSRAALP